MSREVEKQFEEFIGAATMGIESLDIDLAALPYGHDDVADLLILKHVIENHRSRLIYGVSQIRLRGMTAAELLQLPEEDLG